VPRLFDAERGSVCNPVMFETYADFSPPEAVDKASPFGRVSSIATRRWLQPGCSMANAIYAFLLVSRFFDTRVPKSPSSQQIDPKMSMGGLRQSPSPRP
jgi:hypothetical protein